LEEGSTAADFSAAAPLLPTIFFLAHPTNNLSKREIEREKQKISVAALQASKVAEANELFVFHSACYMKMHGMSDRSFNSSPNQIPAGLHFL
jgi:hypothetical protein